MIVISLKIWKKEAIIVFVLLWLVKQNENVAFVKNESKDALINKGDTSYAKNKTLLCFS